MRECVCVCVFTSMFEDIVRAEIPYWSKDGR